MHSKRTRKAPGSPQWRPLRAAARQPRPSRATPWPSCPPACRAAPRRGFSWRATSWRPLPLCPRLGLRVGGPDELDEVGLRCELVRVVHRQLAVHDAQLAAAEKLLGLLRLLGRGVRDDIQPLIGRERPELGVVDEGFVVSHFFPKSSRAVGESEALMARDEALKSTKKGLL